MKNTILALTLLTSLSPFVSYFAEGFPSENYSNNFRQGVITIIHPDGVHTVIHYNGQMKSIIHPNGKMSTVMDTPSTKIITHPDGRVTTVYKQGIQSSIINPDGSMSIISHYGLNNVITSSNGTQVTIYDNGTTKSVIGPDGIWLNLHVSKSDKSLDDPDAAELVLITSAEAIQKSKSIPQQSVSTKQSRRHAQEKEEDSFFDFIYDSFSNVVKKLINSIF
ncbi:hypothetical protein [Flectobacillus roseus]|uniref:hypothetical protein n=1 Tax=Flectobacillus roseus TaxID=502259 RepID=UPI0024B74C97|nr:hypothetical protein [Flectobacillus roseus]MDI9867917.1 hypothetical protein [Flectobacillus roseus]